MRDLDESAAQPLIDAGASFGESPKQMAQDCDVIITCLPSPEICAAVVEGPDGILEGIGPGKVWMEMSTTDAEEVQRLGALVKEAGAEPATAPYLVAAIGQLPAILRSLPDVSARRLTRSCRS